MTTAELEALTGFKIPTTFEMVMTPDGKVWSRSGGEWRETDAEPVRLATSEHFYVSTACLHELHGQCRQRCKFCDEPCHCPCHEGQRP